MKTKLLFFFLVVFSIGNAQPPLHHFTFDGHYYNTTTTTSFFQPPGNFFRADRFALPYTYNAIEVNPGVSSIAGGAMANIPVGTSPRSISIWVKFISPLNSNNNFYIFGYGGSADNEGFNLTQEYNSASPGGLHQVIVSSHNSYSSAKVTANVEVALNTWYHYVVTFNGSIVKIYRNGVMLQQDTVSGWNTTFIYNGALRIGGNSSGNTGSAMHIDDLQIFDYVLDSSSVTSLYQFNTTLSSSGISQSRLKVSLYPNPVSDILNIESDTAIKSVVIYNLQGQKVKSSTQKQTNVSELARGSYTVRIQDANNGLTSHKIIKE